MMPLVSETPAASVSVEDGPSSLTVALPIVSALVSASVPAVLSSSVPEEPKLNDVAALVASSRSLSLAPVTARAMLLPVPLLVMVPLISSVPPVAVMLLAPVLKLLLMLALTVPKPVSAPPLVPDDAPSKIPDASVSVPPSSLIVPRLTVCAAPIVRLPVAADLQRLVGVVDGDRSR